MLELTTRLTPALAGRYAIEREIGRGGMATVYLARDLRHQRFVALKVLDPELGAVLGAERFLSEIRVTANLQHPHLLPLFDSGEADGLLFYVMPFVDGETLRARLEREQQLPVEEAVRIAAAVAHALDYAHGHGVIHRDLKPENVLLQAGQPVVADFGIALAVSNAGGQRVTQTGLSLGTPQYMSPEQATGDRVIDGRTDIYSLGAVTYEMLAGEPPHTGPNAQAIVAKLITTAPQPVRALRPSVPAHVAAAIERALAKLPADRFATAGAFAAALGTPPLTTPGFRDDSAPRSPTAASSRATRTVAAALWGWLRPAPSTPSPVLRYALDLDSSEALVDAGRFGRMALSPDGSMLVYIGGPKRALMLRRRDERRATAIPGTERSGTLCFSPDGKAIAVSTAGSSASLAGTTTGDIWLRRLGSGANVKLSVERGVHYYPRWSRDGTQLSYVSVTDSTRAIVRKPADGSGPPAVLLTRRGLIAGGLSRDGAWLTYGAADPQPRMYVRGVRDDSATRLLPAETGVELGAFPSPDGRWIAYVVAGGPGDGLPAVYVSPFPNAGAARWLVSTGPAMWPVWSPRGDELFYRDVGEQRMMAVPIATTPTFSAGAPRALLPAGQYQPGYDVTPDGSRFLMVRSLGGAARERLVFVEHWARDLGRRP